MLDFTQITDVIQGRDCQLTVAPGPSCADPASGGCAAADPAVLLIEVIFFRKWCTKFCPLGAIMSLISGANKTLRPTIDDGKCLQTTKGISCLMCAKSCPEHINIRKPEESPVSLNNCTKCHECSSHCPAKAISFPLLPKKGGAAEGGEVE